MMFSGAQQPAGSTRGQGLEGRSSGLRSVEGLELVPFEGAGFSSVGAQPVLGVAASEVQHPFANPRTPPPPLRCTVPVTSGMGKALGMVFVQRNLPSTSMNYPN